MTDVKITFDSIKKVVEEKYTGDPMEIAALNGDITSIAEMLESAGGNGDDAGAIMQLIRSGMSSEEALMSIKKE